MAPSADPAGAGAAAAAAAAESGGGGAGGAGGAGVAGGEDKKKKDFSEDLKAEEPVARELAKAGRLGEAVELLLALEKKARLASDVPTLVQVAELIVRLCRECGDWGALNTNVAVLNKRRSQFKQVQMKVVQAAYEYVEETPTKEAKLALIATLRTASEGKIFLEVERARLTMKLAMIREEEGDIDTAASVLQEEQVETYGGMDKPEKFHYLLEQVRLCLAKRDYVRAFILSKKVNRKVLDEPNLEEHKIRFYRLLIKYFTHEEDAFELAKCYLALFRCPGLQEDEASWVPELQHAVLFLALSPYDNHQVRSP